MSAELPKEYWMITQCATRTHFIKTADCPHCRIAAFEALLLTANCPNERNTGHERTWQCQWCDERLRLTESETPPHLRGPIIQAHADTNGVPPQHTSSVTDSIDSPQPDLTAQETGAKHE
jgi:hypothetical protein